MRNSCVRRGNYFFAALAITIAIAPVAAADQPKLYSVEEDWEMVINDPDVATHSPQVTFFACPDAANDDDVYFQLQMNYHALEDFTGGGFHVGAFEGDTQKDEARSKTRIPLRLDGDRVSWTSIMACVNHRFYFAVNNGQGDDWGSFGGPEYLVSLDAGLNGNLEGYRPEKSQELVDVGFGGNRVSAIRLKTVRYYYTDGTMQKRSFGQVQNETASGGSDQ